MRVFRATAVDAATHTGAGVESLRTQIATSVSELESLRQAWTELFESSKSINPFARWEWTYNWWQLVARSDGRARDELFVISHLDQSGTVRGITPLVKTRLSIGPFSVTKLRNAGSVTGANLTEMYPYLWAVGWEEPVALSLANLLGKNSAGYDWLELNGIPEDNTFGLTFLGTPLGLRGRRGPTTPFFLLKLPATWEELKQTLSANTREYIRQSDKRIERLVYDEGHNCHYELIDEPGPVLEALEEFFTLHAARSAMVADVHDPAYHPDNFRVPAQQDFLRHLAMDLAPQRNFRIARLVVDEQTVACRILFSANDHMFLYYSGFDPRWRQYNVMAQVTITWIRHAIATRECDYVNLSTNADSSKLRWRPEPAHWLANLEYVSPTVRGRAIDALRKSATAVWNRRVRQAI